jgi:hypothetical protein
MGRAMLDQPAHARGDGQGTAGGARGVAVAARACSTRLPLVPGHRPNDGAGLPRRSPTRARLSCRAVRRSDQHGDTDGC